MKVNPQTWEAELIYPVSGAVNGITFRANEPNILYVMMRGTSSYSPNTLSPWMSPILKVLLKG